MDHNKKQVIIESNKTSQEIMRDVKLFSLLDKFLDKYYNEDILPTFRKNGSIYYIEYSKPFDDCLWSESFQGNKQELEKFLNKELDIE